MKFLYLLFNLAVIAGPLGLSFDRNVRYYTKWKNAFPAIFLAAIPYLLWDVVVADRHWFFAPEYTLGIQLLGLPIEEWLFFLTVPFSCIFIWEVLRHYFPVIFDGKIFYHWSFALPWLGLAVIAGYFGKEYTALATLAMGVSVFLDHFLKTNLYRTRAFYYFLALVILTTLIFNGFLTAMPIVTYDPQYQLDFRIYTIPIEDFLFGISHLTIVLVGYVWIGNKLNN